MKTYINIIAIIFIFYSCNQINKDKEPKRQVYDLEVKDSTGIFDGRHIGFEIVSTYESGSPKEIAYYIEDTTLIHILLEHGRVIEKHTFIRNESVESIYLDSTGWMYKKVEDLKNDTIPDLRREIYYKKNGEIDGTGLRGKDSLFLGVWKAYLDNDTVIEFDHGFSGSQRADTVRVYYKEEFIGLRIWNVEKGKWIFENKKTRANNHTACRAVYRFDRLFFNC